MKRHVSLFPAVGAEWFAVCDVCGEPCGEDGQRTCAPCERGGAVLTRIPAGAVYSWHEQEQFTSRRPSTS